MEDAIIMQMSELAKRVKNYKEKAEDGEKYKEEYNKLLSEMDELDEKIEKSSKENDEYKKRIESLDIELKVSNLFIFIQ